MPLLELSPNIQDVDPSRKRTHDDFVDSEGLSGFESEAVQGKSLPTMASLPMSGISTGESIEEWVSIRRMGLNANILLPI